MPFTPMSDGPQRVLPTVVVDVTGVPVPILGTTVITYDELPAVSAGVETTIVSYTVPAEGSYIQQVMVSGDNIALYKVKVDSTTIATCRTSFTQFNERFDLDGYTLTSGQVLDVTVIHNRPTTGAFEASIYSR